MKFTFCFNTLIKKYVCPNKLSDFKNQRAKIKSKKKISWNQWNIRSVGSAASHPIKSHTIGWISVMHTLASCWILNGIFFSESLSLNCRRDPHDFISFHVRFDATVLQLSSELVHVLFQDNLTLPHVFCAFSESSMQGFVVNPTWVHQVVNSGHQNFLGLIDICLIELIDDFLVILHCKCLVFPFHQFFDLISVDFVEQHDHQSFTLIFSFDLVQHILNQPVKYFFDSFYFC